MSATTNHFQTVLPGKVKDLSAELESPTSIHVAWKKPEEGGPITGYKFMYWDRPEEIIAANVDHDVCLCKFF